MLHGLMCRMRQVLLSDVDIVTLRNPFPHLMRDCDVEAMSDGWDNATAYGAHMPSWAGGQLSETMDDAGQNRLACGTHIAALWARVLWRLPLTGLVVCKRNSGMT